MATPRYSYSGLATVTYDASDFIAQGYRGWDNYQTRLARYEILDGYYHNISYHSIETYAQTLKAVEKMYKNARGVYNPDNRLVESYVSKTHGGMLDTESAKTGAIPIDTENDALRDAIIRVWVDSLWGQKKSLYVRYGAKCGDTFIKVVDDIHKGQVRLEVVDPAKIKRIEKDTDGSIIYAEFEYYIYSQESSERTTLYREIITPEAFEVWGDDKPLAIHRNAQNELIPAWANEYGFVPLVHVQHTDVGLNYGAPAIHGALHKINEINDLASILNDGMRKQVQLPLVFRNVKPRNINFGASDGNSSTDTSGTPKKDMVNAVFISGDNAGVDTLSPTINIQDGLANIVNILNELERDLPELSLHRLRESTNATAPGVRSAFDDAIAKYQEARGNYDTGLIEAHKMAIAIGGMRGYRGYEGFNLMSLENDSLDHKIKERAVIKDSLSKREKIELLISASSTGVLKPVMKELDYSKDEIEETLATVDEQSALFRNSGNLEVTPPDVDDDTPEEAEQRQSASTVDDETVAAANGRLNDLGI